MADNQNSAEIKDGYAMIRNANVQSSFVGEYLIDEVADLQNLPTAKKYVGSTAICIEDSSVYILSVNKGWQKLI